MFRLMILLGAVLALLVLAISCEDTSPTSPDISQEVYPQICGLDSFLTALEGELRAVAFEVVVSTMDGDPAAGSPIALWVDSGPGYTAYRDGVTDAQGVVQALYYVSIPLGDTVSIIKAAAGSDTTEATVSLHGDLAPASIDLISSLPVIETHYGQPAQSEMVATVLNPTGLPVQDVNVAFSVVSGEAECGGIVVTDALGHAAASLAVDGYWFGEAIVSAAVVRDEEASSIDGSNPLERRLMVIEKRFRTVDSDPLVATTSVEIRLAVEVGLQFLTPDTSIGLNAGDDRFTVCASLADEDENPIPNQTVSFTCNEAIANIVQAAVTDDEGIVTADVVLTGAPGMMTIHAGYEPLGLADSISVEVVDSSPLRASLEILNGDNQIWADSSYDVLVEVRSADGRPAVGVPVQLVSSLGNLTPLTAPTDRNGIVMLPYTPRRSGEERLTVTIDDLRVVAVPLEFRVFQMPMIISETLSVDESGQPTRAYNYRFTIIDTRGEPVPGERLECSITEGWVNRQFAITGSFGQGSIEIHWDGGTPVTAVFSVRWRDYSNEYELPFTPPGPSTIVLTADPLEIAVAGSDGNSTSILRAAVRDIRGRPVVQPATVVFMLWNQPDPPEGCNINDNGDIDSTATVNGVVMARLNAGTRIGGVLVRAYTWRDSTRTDTVSVILSTVAVVAGPPFQFDIDIDLNGRYLGNGDWDHDVSVRMWDIHRNPISVEYPTTGVVDPPVAVIGDFEGGRSTLVYNIRDALTPVIITITVTSEQGLITGSTRFTLPMPQGGRIQLDAEPMDLFFDNERDTLDVELLASLLYEDEILLVDNVPISFSSNRANFFSFNPETQGFESLDVPLAVTTEGVSTIFLRGRMDDFFLDPFTEEVTVQVNAEVGGIELAAEPIFITVRRDNGFVANIELSVDDDGIDAGAGAWSVEVAALVTDLDGNPVRDHIPVVFTVEPEIANIDPGYTGNVGRSGNPTPGVAYADLVYNGVNSCDLIEITAEVQGDNGVILRTIRYVLPIQEGRINIEFDGERSWQFPDDGDECWFGGSAVVMDGHGINLDVQLEFNSNLGDFRPGRFVNSGENIFFGGREEDFFPDPPGDTAFVWVTAAVNAQPDVTSDTLRFVITRSRGFAANIELNIDPVNLLIDEDNRQGIFTVWATVTDPQGNPVNGVPVLFTTNRAPFFWFDREREQHVGFYPEPAIEITGAEGRQQDEADGVATVYLIVDEWWDPDPFTLELTIQVNAQVVGNDELSADPVFAFITRRGGG